MAEADPNAEFPQAGQCFEDRLIDKVMGLIDIQWEQGPALFRALHCRDVKISEQKILQ